MATGSTLLKTKSIKFEEEWPRVRPVVLKLLNQESVSKGEWQDLFWAVHTLSSWADKGGQKIFEALQKEVSEFVRGATMRILSPQDDNTLLKTYIAEWTKFSSQSIFLPMPFGQLEQNMGCSSPKAYPKISQHKSKQDEGVVRKMMLETWSKNIFAAIQQRLQACALKLVALERNGELFDSQLVIGVRESYVYLCTEGDDRLSLYKENFERSYIEETERFYRSKAQMYMVENGVQIYMKYADDKLREEEQRGNKYLETGQNSNSVQLLLQKCVDVLVVAFQDQILAECPAMIKNNEIEKLFLMFRLLDRSPAGIPPMLKYLEDHIRSQGLADMIANAETITTDSERYVDQLLDMFHRFSTLVREAFNDDPRFLTSRDKAFRDVVNDITVFKLELPTKQKGAGSKTLPESKCPELLANYCDMLLRKTPLSKKLTSDEIDTKLQDVLLVLKYVQNKDVFMRYHKAHLARRLILDASADSEKEEAMVNKLRDAGMPTDFINKLYRMLLDVEVSNDVNKAFKGSSSCSNNNRNTVAESVNIKILNGSAWSTRASERVTVSLPRELEDFIPEVEDFYRSQHNGRKLQWHHHMSNGTILFANDTGRFDLEVTTFQMAVLFCWNERPMDKITYENIRLATELPDMELRRTLWSLVAYPKIKYQVLLCDCDTKNPKDFTDSTLFWPNQEFCLIKNGRPQRRGRINLIGRLQLSIEPTKEDENDAIVQLRILRVQEAIVKIMKMRKRLTNAQLQTELVEMLKNMFLPARKMMKEQIEWLIENKYMARDDDDINVFLYLA